MGKRKKRKVSENSELFASEFDSDDEEDWTETDKYSHDIRDEKEEDSREETPISSKISYKELENLSSNTDEVVLYDSQTVFSDKVIKISDKPVMIRLKISEFQKFKIVLKNPYNNVAAHIEGKKLNEQNYRTFKLPIQKIRGSWIVTIQTQDKNENKSTEYKIIVK